MARDRDLHVAVMSAWHRRRGPGTRAWDMLAATGVRGLRVLHEAGGFGEFEFTEAHPQALRVLQPNVARYAAEGARHRAFDARAPLATAAFDYVDLDPFGSPLEYLPAAIQALRPGGLLAVTATDLRVLGGADVPAARRRYQGEPVRGRLGPEGGLRLLLATVTRCAAASGRFPTVQLAYVGSHHLRAYVVIDERSASTPDPPVSAVETSEWTGPPLGPAPRYGPLWIGPLFDRSLIATLEPPRTAQDPAWVTRMIETLRVECLVDRPFFYEGNGLAAALGLAQPPRTDRLAEALRAAGYRSAPTHARAGAFRTDAPYATVVAATRTLTR